MSVDQPSVPVHWGGRRHEAVFLAWNPQKCLRFRIWTSPIVPSWIATAKAEMTQ